MHLGYSDLLLGEFPHRCSIATPNAHCRARCEGLCTKVADQGATSTCAVAGNMWPAAIQQGGPLLLGWCI